MTTLVIVLTIIAAVIALIALLLVFGRVTIRIVNREELKLTISVLGIKTTWYTSEQKFVKTKSLSRCRHPERVLKREVRKRQKAVRDALKRKEKAKKNPLTKQSKREKPLSELSFSELKGKLETILKVLKWFWKVTKGRITLRIRALKIAVGSDDAAKTAILYGVISQSVAYLLEWAEQRFSKVQCRPGKIAIIPDYTASQCCAEIDLSCILTLPQAISIYVLTAYRKENDADTEEQIENPFEKSCGNVLDEKS